MRTRFAPTTLTLGLLILALLLTAAQPALAQRKRNKDKKDKPAPVEQIVPTSIAAPARPAGPVLALAAERHEFGRVQQGELVRHTFVLTNDGSQDLVIAEVKPSCGCTAPTWPRQAIKPGEKAEIQVVFNTAGKLGPQQKYITVRSNAAPEPKNLYLVGEVISPTIPLLGGTTPKQN